MGVIFFFAEIDDNTAWPVAKGGALGAFAPPIVTHFSKMIDC